MVPRLAAALAPWQWCPLGPDQGPQPLLLILAAHLLVALNALAGDQERMILGVLQYPLLRHGLELQLGLPVSWMSLQCGQCQQQ